MSLEDKIYIIRSSGSILGPYSKKEIEDLLEDGSFSINDEVIKPGSIGFYLQDHPDFYDFIQSIGMQMRLTNFVMGISGKLTSVTAKTIKNSDRTQTITTGLDIDSEEDISQAEEVKFQFVDEPVNPKGKNASSKLQSQYISSKESEKVARQRVALIIKRAWQSIILSSVFLGCFVVFSVFIRPYQEKNKSLDQIREEGEFFYEAGNYDRAYKFFKDGLNNNFLAKEEKNIMLDLFLQRGDVEEADILLKELEQHLVEDKINIAKGLISFLNKSYSKAEDFFKKVSGDFEQDARINIILSRWMQKDYRSVFNRSNKMISSGYERGVIFYLKNFSLLKMGEKNSQIKENIKSALSSSPEFYQEQLLLLAYISLQEGRLNEVESFIKRILDRDLNFYKEYKYSSLISLKVLNWSDLLSYCHQIFQANSQNAYFNALYGFCHIKVGDYQKGNQYIEISKSQKPKDDLIVSLVAYKLMLQGSYSKAEILLEKISSESSYLLPSILKARLLERKEQWSVAIRFWKSLSEKYPYNIFALSGLAYNYHQMGDVSNMKIYKERGLSRYPHYVKLLSLPEVQ